MSAILNFYEPDDPNGYLSNFASYSVYIDGRCWPTSEHFYQAQKFVGTAVFEHIASARTPAECFALSREHESAVRDDWHQVKDAVMERAISTKFAQHPRLAFRLVATGESVIKEHSHTDSYWGDGGDGSGENRLGHILMRERQRLAVQAPYNQLLYVDSCKLPTRHGLFRMHGFRELSNNREHVVLSHGSWSPEHAPLVRLHSQCLTGDVFTSLRCDCGPQLNRALGAIVEAGAGLLVYLPQEGRGIGLLNKIRAYRLQEAGVDTVDANLQLGFAADLRDFSICRALLTYFSVNQVRLLTNNPDKISAMEKLGVEVVERVPIEIEANDHSRGYLETKNKKMGHLLSRVAEARDARQGL